MGVHGIPGPGEERMNSKRLKYIRMFSYHLTIIPLLIACKSCFLLFPSFVEYLLSRSSSPVSLFLLFHAHKSMGLKSARIWTFVLLTSVAFGADYTCSPSAPCATGCCSNGGVCGLGPTFCGAGNCTSSCDYKSDCDPGWGAQWSNAEKCPLNVCCSKFGFCGISFSPVGKLWKLLN